MAVGGLLCGRCTGSAADHIGRLQLSTTPRPSAGSHLATLRKYQLSTINGRLSSGPDLGAPDLDAQQLQTAAVGADRWRPPMHELDSASNTLGARTNRMPPVSLAHRLRTLLF